MLTFFLPSCEKSKSIEGIFLIKLAVIVAITEEFTLHFTFALQYPYKKEKNRKFIRFSNPSSSEI